MVMVIECVTCTTPRGYNVKQPLIMCAPMDTQNAELYNADNTMALNK